MRGFNKVELKNVRKAIFDNAQCDNKYAMATGIFEYSKLTKTLVGLDHDKVDREIVILTNYLDEIGTGLLTDKLSPHYAYMLFDSRVNDFIATTLKPWVQKTYGNSTVDDMFAIHPIGKS